jgi:hypothetical protein
MAARRGQFSRDYDRPDNQWWNFNGHDHSRHFREGCGDCDLYFNWNAQWGRCFAGANDCEWRHW